MNFSFIKNRLCDEKLVPFGSCAVGATATAWPCLSRSPATPCTLHTNVNHTHVFLCALHSLRRPAVRRTDNVQIRGKNKQFQLIEFMVIANVYTLIMDMCSRELCGERNQKSGVCVCVCVILMLVLCHSLCFSVVSARSCHSFVKLSITKVATRKNNATEHTKRYTDRE